MPKPTKPTASARAMTYAHAPVAATGYDADDTSTYHVLQVYPGGRERRVTPQQDVYQTWLAKGGTPTVRDYVAPPAPPVDRRTARAKADADIPREIPMALIARAAAGDADAVRDLQAGIATIDQRHRP